MTKIGVTYTKTTSGRSKGSALSELERLSRAGQIALGRSRLTAVSLDPLVVLLARKSDAAWALSQVRSLLKGIA